MSNLGLKFWKDWKSSYQILQILAPLLQTSCSNKFTLIFSYDLRLPEVIKQIKKLIPGRIMDKMFETNSNFHMKFGIAGKISIFQIIFASLDKIFI